MANPKFLEMDEMTPLRTKKEKKPSKKHPSDAELILQMIDTIKVLKTIPKREQWNSLAYVNEMNYASRNTFLRHFGSFDAVMTKAIKKIKDDGLKIYYQDRR